MENTVTPLSIAKCPPASSSDFPTYNWETQSLDYQGEGEFKAARAANTRTHSTRTGIPLFEDPDYDSDDDDK